MKVLDLFSGIGGFSLGLESTGFFETVAFCEKDDFCKKVLQKHWGDIKIYDDIRSVKDEIQADVVTGGFPCQSFSQAGLQKGRADDRFLWNEMFDVIKKVRPRWVIGENVQGIINIEEGMVLRQVQNDLDSEGFKVQCFIIPASGIGAWHNRNRVWILACNISNSNSIRHRRRNSTRCADEEWTFLPREQEGREMGSKTKRCSNVSDTDKQRTQVQTKGKQPSIKLAGSKSKETWWETESRICGVPDGVSYGVDRDRTQRIKALGNSIVPQIARQLGLAIMEAENES